jgi:hypothetical protein
VSIEFVEGRSPTLEAVLQAGFVRVDEEPKSKAKRKDDAA